MAPSGDARRRRDPTMNIAVVGTGYVADMYGITLRHHPELQLVSAFDTDEEHLSAFCRRWPAAKYRSLQHLLDDPAVEIVLNLTNPRSHFEVTKRCLEAGKHVYSEKPLAMTTHDAKSLLGLAKDRGLYLASAPCSVLSETAQTVWKAVRDGVVGPMRLVYANFDDGMIAPNMSPWNWQSESGVPWPAKDEFEVGCTFEHAGYVLTWLAAFFGPALRVTSFASCLIPDKGIPVDRMAADFTVGCIEYPGGLVARVTCGLVAPRDKSLTIVGDAGVIFTSNVRDDIGPVYLQTIPPRGRQGHAERCLDRTRVWIESWLSVVPWSGHQWHFKRKLPFARVPSRALVHPDKRVDFLRGPSELAEAIRDSRPCRLSAELGVHIVEIVEALQNPDRFGGGQAIESTFEPIKPLPWGP